MGVRKSDYEFTGQPKENREKIEDVLSLIESERKRQDAQHGGPEHDEEHTPNDWIAYIVKQLGKTFDAEFNFGSRVSEVDRYYLEFQHRMVKVAALAVAAIQATERMRKRHNERQNINRS